MPIPNSGAENPIKPTNTTDATPAPDQDPNAPAKPAAVEFASRYLGKPKKKAEPDEAAPVKKPDAPKKKAKAQPLPPEEPKGPTFDEEKLGRAIGETISKSLPKSEKAEPKDSGAELTPAEARRVRVLEQMEKSWPEQYKGYASKFRENMTKLREYAANWEKENPGKKFDEDDEQHAEFVSGLESEVEYDSDDYSEALADLKFSEKAEKDKAKSPDPQVEELNRRLGEFERKEKIRESAPILAQTSAEVGNEFWKLMGDDYKGVVAEDGSIDQDVLAEIKAKDSDLFGKVVGAAQAVEGYAKAVYLLDQGLLEYDPKNEVHKFLSDSALRHEKHFAGLPAEKQVNDEGKRFSTKEQWSKMTPEQRNRHWTFTHADIAFMVADDIAKDVTAAIKRDEESFLRRAKAKGLIADKVDPVKPEEHPMAARLRRMRNPEPEEAADDADDPDEKPASPSTMVVPRLASPKPAGAQASKTGVNAFVMRALRGK